MEQPSHTLALRSALEYCLSKLSLLADTEYDKENTALPIHCGTKIRAKLRANRGSYTDLQQALVKDALAAARALPARRSEACQEFWESVRRDTATRDGDPSFVFPRYNVEECSPLAFKKQVIHRNVPCILTGLDKTYFRRADERWRRHNGDGVSADEEATTSDINIRWFLENVPHYEVPIKQSPSSANCLDKDGRAQECDLCFPESTLQDWITRNHRLNSDLYLKDWHFIKQWEERKAKVTTMPQSDLSAASKDKLAHEIASDDDDLYAVPPHFQRDLLNPFFMRFMDDDYRFVYWGSLGSSTGLHSDVLNSFSWSYNVVGEKLWTFYPLSACEALCDNDAEPLATVQVTQRSGECIFVPAGWRHTVLNTKETLSINHNWTTSCALHFMWACIKLEINAVQDELNAWGIDETVDFGAKERMLLGCVGMNLSSFLFMLLVESVELIEDLLCVTPKRLGYDDNLWENCFSLFCISQILEAITRRDVRTVSSPEAIIDDLDERLTAMLNSRALAQKASTTAAEVLRIVEFFFKYSTNV